jgi:hypothetical protein
MRACFTLGGMLMNQKQVADSLNISETSVCRYKKALLKYHPTMIRRVGKTIYYDVEAYRAIKYMNLLVSRGLPIEEAVVPVLRDIYEMDVDNLQEVKCLCCQRMQKQLDSYDALVKQQQETIVYLTEKLVEK